MRTGKRATRAWVTILLAGLVLTACGGEDAPSRDGAVSAGPDAVERNSDLRERASALLGDLLEREDVSIGETGELVRRLERELGELAGEELRRANKRLTQIIEELRELADAGDELRSTLDELLANVADDARKQLEDLSDRLPDPDGAGR